VPEALEAWATMPLADLMQRVQNISQRLAADIENHAQDELAYRRAWWTHWQQCPLEWSVAAAVKDCDKHTLAQYDVKELSRVIMEQQSIKREGMIAVLKARTP
jgi:hypothetical protein